LDTLLLAVAKSDEGLPQRPIVGQR